MSASFSAEEYSLPVLVDQVLAHEVPKRFLLATIIQLSKDGRQDLAVSLFESVVWRCNVQDYWIFHTISSCYRLLGRDDASFLLSGLAHQMSPDSSGAFALCRDMFGYYVDHGRALDAMSLFLSYGKEFPQKPFASPHQVLPLLAAAGMSNEQLIGSAQNNTDPSLRSDTVIYDVSRRDGLIFPSYGDLPNAPIERLATPAPRPEVRVSCLVDAEVLIQDNAIIVSDAVGNLQGDLSVHDYPVMLKTHLDSVIPIADTIHIDEAVIVADRFSGPPNLSHYILDGMSRLHLYEAAGVDISNVTVIGGEPREDFQKAVLKIFGVKTYFPTNQTVRLRVDRLWVSSNCRQLRHPAHEGAPWALTYLQNMMRPRDVSPDKKLYLSRSDASSRRVVNEAEVLAELQPYGFEVVVASRLSYAEQVILFSRATHVVSPHGAGLTNVIACAPGTHVLEFFHPLYGTATYAAIMPALGLRYSALVGRDGQSTAPEFNDPVAVRLERNAWGLRNIRVDIKDLRSWIADTFP